MEYTNLIIYLIGTISLFYLYYDLDRKLINEYYKKGVSRFTGGIYIYSVLIHPQDYFKESDFTVARVIYIVHILAAGLALFCFILLLKEISVILG